MMRSTLARNRLATRTVIRPTPITANAIPKRFNSSIPPPQHQQESHVSKHGPMYIVLAVLLGGGIAGYAYMKPVRDAAAQASQVVDTAKSSADGWVNAASQITGIATAGLPAGILTLYHHLNKQPGGITGFISKLKDQKDVDGVLAQLKEAGGDEMKPIIEAVEKKVKQAGGKIEQVDWKALAEELKGQVGEGGQKVIDFALAYVPSAGSVTGMIEQLKKAGEKHIGEIETTANKILQKAKASKEEGKDSVEGLLKAVKDAGPEDFDKLFEQLKAAAKKAGLPSEMVDRYMTKDTKGDAEDFARKTIDQLKKAADTLPGNPDEVVESIRKVSPGLAGLVAMALDKAEVREQKVTDNKKKAM